MKTFIATMSVIVLMFGALHTSQTYVREDCKVISIENNLVTVRDQCGYDWKLYADGLCVGDVVDIKLHDKDTATIEDDEVIDVIARGH
jgi:hypothetical protein